MKQFSIRKLLLLVALTALAVLVAGYHPGAEDDGVYLAAIEHNLNPALFRVDSDFFALQLQATVFDKCMALLVKLTHLPVSVVVLLVHLLAILAILAACHRLAARCFHSACGRWCAVTFIAVFFTLPISGTALYLVDQNLHPRAIATALILFGADRLLARRYVTAFVLLIAAVAFHPIMAAFGLSLCVFLAIPWERMPSTLREVKVTAEELSREPVTAMLAFVPIGWLFEPPSAPWRAAVDTRNYYHLSRWAWYEWLGAIAPIFILFWISKIGEKSGRPMMQRLAKATAFYGAFQLLVAMAMTLPPAMERMLPLQPMRYLHLVYVVMLLLGGGLLGERLLRYHSWRWVALFLPIAVGMFLAQRATYPASPHLELPGVHSSNPWLEAFAWIRTNTPENAYFALGPDYMHRPGEDSHGFRALALRSALADNVKDSAVVTQVPRLAQRWQREIAAQSALTGDWQHVTEAELEQLKSEFGVNWVVVELPNTLELNCPYRNSGVAVCRVD